MTQRSRHDHRQLATVGVKACRSCSAIKPLDEFHRHAANPGGYAGRCKACASERHAAMKASGAIARKLETWAAKSKYRAGIALRSIRHRCKKDGTSCTLTREWLEAKFQAGVCEATGLALDFNGKESIKHAASDFAPSVDRIKAGGDYSPENCRVVCNAFNFGRGKMCDDRAILVWSEFLRRQGFQVLKPDSDPAHRA